MSYFLGFDCCGCVHGVGCSYCLTEAQDLNVKALAVEAKTNTRTESAKILNRRRSKKEAAERVGEELIKACVNLNIDEISTCDRNGLARGERNECKLLKLPLLSMDSCLDRC